MKEQLPCDYCQRPVQRGDTVRGDDAELYHPGHQPELWDQRSDT